MNYYSGSALNLLDLMDKLGVVAGNHGWSYNRSGSSITISKGDLAVDILHISSQPSSPPYEYINLKASTTAGGVNNLGTLAAPVSTSGNTVARCGEIPIGASIAEYHAFIDAGYQVIVFFRFDVGAWRMFSFGVVVKRGTWVGGAYVFGTYLAITNISAGFNPNSALGYPPWDSQFGCSISMTTDGGVLGWGYTTPYITYSPNTPYLHWVIRISYQETLTYPSGWSLFHSSPNQQTGERPLVALDFLQVRSGNFLSPAGYIPNLRLMSVRGVQDAEEFILGTDTWKSFPLLSNQNPLDTTVPYNSGWYGFSVRKSP